MYIHVQIHLKLGTVTFTVSLLHHGSGLGEGETLHGLIALASRSFFRQPVTLTMNEVDQHTTVEGVAFLSWHVSPPRCPVSCFEEHLRQKQSEHNLEGSGT